MFLKFKKYVTQKGETQLRLSIARSFRCPVSRRVKQEHIAYIGSLPVNAQTQAGWGYFSSSAFLKKFDAVVKSLGLSELGEFQLWRSLGRKLGHSHPGLYF